MALRSMTGFGRGEYAHEGVRVVVELSSVNRKQLDVQVGLPRHLAALDRRLTEEIQRHLARGRVTGEVHVLSSAEPLRGAVQIDEARAQAYLASLREAGKRLDLPDDLGLSQLLSWPEVVRFDPPPEDPDAFWPVIAKALQRSLRSLVAMRKEEGRALQADLSARLDRLAELLDQIKQRAPEVVAHYRSSLLQRLRQADIPFEEEDDRLVREIALFAERADITEEITRLTSHLRQARRMLRSGGTSGKSLDFLAQEMFREVNTIGSKANDSQIAQWIVACKTELDRFREQVQNVE